MKTSCRTKDNEDNKWKKKLIKKIDETGMYKLIKTNVQLVYQGAHGASSSRQYCQYDSNRPVAGSIKAVYTVN